MPHEGCRDLICDCRTVLDAKARYEAATARLRYQTTAAWVRWEDMPIDGRLAWVDHPHACSCPTDAEIRAAIHHSHQQLTRSHDA